MMQFIYLVCMLWVTIAVFHEFGHYLLGRRFDPNCYIQFNGGKLFTEVNPDIYGSMTQGQKIGWYVSGIVFGSIPLFIFINYYPWFAIFLLVYVYASKADIEAIIHLYKDKAKSI